MEITVNRKHDVSRSLILALTMTKAAYLWPLNQLFAAFDVIQTHCCRCHVQNVESLLLKFCKNIIYHCEEYEDIDILN